MPRSNFITQIKGDTVKRRKTYSLIAATAATALVLSACTADSDDAEETTGGTDTETTDGGDNGDAAGPDGVVSFTTGADEYNGYNGFLSSTYSTHNSVINERMSTGFGFFNANGEWQNGTDLGSYEMISDDPLTVEYTINEEAVYQGGTPITCEDYYMDWVSKNPQWILDGQAEAGKTNEDGSGAPLFDHVSDSGTYALPVENGPECETGDKSFTVTYNAPNPDWELVISSALPSHVMAEKVGLSKEELFEAFKNEDFEVAQQVADAWNNWYSPNPGEIQPIEEVPSFGPFTYMEGGWQPGEYITLVPNPDWWGEAPGVEELVFRFIAPEGQLQALENQDVNVIEPQGTQDALDSLEAMDGIEILTGPTMIWEHLDYNWAEGSVFSDANGGFELREAFAYCAPREDIVERLVRPLDEETEVMNLREYFPSDADYDEVLDAAYDGRYDTVDIERATELVEASGVENPTVRIGYSAPNQRRSDTVALIQSSCAEAGITVEDIGSADFFAPGGALDTGNYDIALFAWSGSGQIVSGRNIYHTDGQQNYHAWSNETVDAEWDKINGSLDENVWLESKKIIETELWNDLFNLPIYAHPGIVAHTEGLQNVERNLTQTGVVWNAEEWTW